MIQTKQGPTFKNIAPYSAASDQKLHKVPLDMKMNMQSHSGFQGITHHHIIFSFMYTNVRLYYILTH